MTDLAIDQNLNWVTFGALGGGQEFGAYRQVDRYTWHEDSVADGRDIFEFKETRRDQWTVHLFDASRKVTLQIDLHARIIYYHDHESPRWELYSILSSSERPTGWLVNWVDFGPSADAIDGSYKQTGPKQWVETGADGSVAFEFEELYRDDWSIYLTDTSRDVDIQLDMHRRMVRLGIGGGDRADQYLIARVSTKLNGWIVNSVDFGGADGSIAGTFRQTGAKTWVEDSATAGAERSEFREYLRDDWSVYLWDESRKLEMILDLHRKLTVISFGDIKRQPQHFIHNADAFPKVVTEDPKTVTWVEFGDADGNPAGVLRQTGTGTWDEDLSASGGGVRSLGEVVRDKWIVHLRDRQRGTEIEIDLHEGEVVHRGGGEPRRAWKILNSHSLLTGWLVNHVDMWSAGVERGALRQTGWTSWAEDSRANGPVYSTWEEVHRSEWSVQLSDPSRNATILIDLYNKRISYSGPHHPQSELAEIRTALHGPELWRRPHKITSRSALTEDFDVDAATKKRTPKSVYRTSVSLSHFTTHVDVWASDETELEINGERHAVDKVRSVRVNPSALSKLTISLAANDLQCPRLYLRSNLMTADQTHIVMPDVEAHKKIVGMKKGDLYAARHQLDLNPKLKKDHVEHIQKALQNLAKSVQHSYNQTPHGYHHDRAVHPANMDHAHFKLDFSGGGARYVPLSKQEVHDHIRGARIIEIPAGQNIITSIGHLFSQAAHIVIHTADNVVHDVVDTVEHVAKDVVETVDHVGEDLIHGDILKAGKDLIQGGEHLGTDLVKGVKHVAGDVVKGAGQIIGVTLKLGEDLVQFVIKHTGIVGHALGWLLHKAGAALGSVVGWLLDKIGWGDVMQAHDVFVDMINGGIDGLVKETEDLKAEADTYFHNLSKDLSAHIDQALDSLHIGHFADQPSPHKSHSGAVEKMEWLLGKFIEYSTMSPAMAVGMGGNPNPLAKVVEFAESELDADGGQVRAAFSHALEHIKRIFEHPDAAPKELLGALLEVLRGIALLGLDVISKVLDLLLDFFVVVLRGAKALINAPIEVPFLSDFYEGLTHGRKLTVLSAISLVIAAPATIMCEAAFGRKLFAGRAAGQALDIGTRPQLPIRFADRHVERLYDMSLGYGFIHLVMGTLMPVAQVLAYLQYRDDKDEAEGIEDEEAKAGAIAKAESHVAQSRGTVALAAFIYGCFAQAMIRPAPVGESVDDLKSASIHDLFEAPDAVSWIIWRYQFGGVALSLLAVTVTGADVVGKMRASWGESSGTWEAVGKYGSDVVLGLTSLYGFAHGGLHMALVDKDRRKINTLDTVFGQRQAGDEVDKMALGTGRTAAAALVRMFDQHARDENGNLKEGRTRIADARVSDEGRGRAPGEDGDYSSLYLDIIVFEAWLDEHFLPYETNDEGKVKSGKDGSAKTDAGRRALAHVTTIAAALKSVAEKDYEHTENSNAKRKLSDRHGIEWLYGCYVYWIWSQTSAVGAGNPVKGTGNFFDAIPEFVQAAAIPQFVDAFDGIPLVVVVAADGIGHFIEGITYLVRSSTRTLY